MAENIQSTQGYVFAYLARHHLTPTITDTVSMILNSDHSTAFVAALYSAYINKGMLLLRTEPQYNRIVKVAKRMLSNGEFLEEIKKQEFYDIPLADVERDEWEALINATFAFMHPVMQSEKFVELASKRPTKSFSLGSIGRGKMEKVSEVTKEDFGLEKSLQMTNVIKLSNRITRLANEVAELKDGRLELENEIMRLNNTIRDMINSMDEMEKKLMQVLAYGPSQRAEELVHNFYS